MMQLDLKSHGGGAFPPLFYSNKKGEMNHGKTS